MNDLNTIASNMRHAARNNESAEIGGGMFGPAELREAAKALRSHGELLAALQDCEANMIISTQADMIRLDRIRAAIAKATGEKA